uniref:Dirigent protein n=1 Tax=Panagrellus redivivus TaxID=6233 RepID=A0A7E4W9N4_PANRE
EDLFAFYGVCNLFVQMTHVKTSYIGRGAGPRGPPLPPTNSFLPLRQAFVVGNYIFTSSESGQFNSFQIFEASK